MVVKDGGRGSGGSGGINDANDINKNRLPLERRDSTTGRSADLRSLKLGQHLIVLSQEISFGYLRFDSMKQRGHAAVTVT